MLEWDEKWHRHFIQMAKLSAQMSKDPSTKAGAVIVRPDKTVASMGFNGFAKGMKDDQSLYDDRELKYERIVHCEMNAILFAREPLDGFGLYVWPLPCCSRCAVHVIQTGIKYVFAPSMRENKDLTSRWGCAIGKSMEAFSEAEVHFREISL